MVLAVGCDSSAGTAAGGVSRRDSAGIEIVESHGSGAALSAWTIDAAPRLEIGAIDGPEDYLLNKVRGALRLSGGRVVVAEADARIRYYDSAGRHLRTFAFVGDGPLELRRVVALYPLRGDTVVATTNADVGMQEWLMHVAVIDPSGAVVRKHALRWASPPWRETSEGISIIPWGPYVGIDAIAADGSFIIRTFDWQVLSGSTGTHWVKEPYYRVAFDGSRADTLAVLPTRTIIERADLRRGYATPLFARNAPKVALHGNLLYWGNGDSFEVQIYDLSTAARLTTPVRIIRYQSDRAPLTGVELIESWLGVMVRPATSAAESTFIRDAERPSLAMQTLPEYRRMMTDAAGNLWVESTRVGQFARDGDDDTEPNVWNVFDSTGALVSTVSMPLGLAITQIGSDWVLGIWQDENGVEHVRLHGISKAGSQSG